MKRGVDIQESITRLSLNGTVWRENCEKCDTDGQFLNFRSDGLFGYSSKASIDFVFDGTDSWKIIGNELVLTWSDGYATSTYTRKEGQAKTLEGSQSNVDGWNRLTRMPKSPNNQVNKNASR